MTTPYPWAIPLEPDPADPYGFYDRFGNRLTFYSHREYEVARRLHIIQWLTKGALLCFL